MTEKGVTMGEVLRMANEQAASSADAGGVVSSGSALGSGDALPAASASTLGASGLDGLASLAAESSPSSPSSPSPDPGKPVVDQWGRAWGTGRRKSAVARVILSRGNGRITVNRRPIEEYLPRDTSRLLVRRPLESVKMEDSVDITCRVSGGGASGQAGAISHGIARALVNYNPSLRSVLRAQGLLTRDSRVVERKKYGRAKARKSFQFSKR